MAKVLSDLSVKQMKPHKARREIHDGGCRGLYLHVQPSGAKSYVMLLARQKGGKMGKLHLGPVDLSGRQALENPQIGDQLTLADAHWLAKDIRRQQRAGKDVIADRAAAKALAERQQDIPQRDNSFAAVARQFIDEHARPNTRRWLETARYLGWDYSDETAPTMTKGGLAAARWADKPVDAITDDDVYFIVDDAKRHGIPGQGKRNKGISNARGRAMARTLSKFFKWAKGERKIKINPSKDIEAPKPPKKRERWLNDNEIAVFWRATNQVNEPFRQLCQLLLLTGQRLQEVAGMRLAELGDDRALWTIPSGRTKNKLEHEVPLPPMARNIIAKIKPVAGKSGYVFTTTGNTSVSGFSKVKQRLDELMQADAEKHGMEIEPWRLHDLRRSTATGMSKSLKIRPHIIEATLNHISGAKSGVAGTYNWDDYGPEKKAALERWADHVEKIVGKVVQLRGRKRK
jgi:integrase